ncbi:MAG: serine hydrolase, partial [Mycobacterium sp.]
MNPTARAAALALVVALVAGCGADRAESGDPIVPAPPESQSSPEAPPPLATAQALPENAVENAVSKLDGMVEDLMAKSG